MNYCSCAQSLISLASLRRVWCLLVFACIAQCVGAQTLTAWGDNSYGQRSLSVSNATEIAAGGWHSVALKSDGTVVATGNNQDGQTIIPAGLSGVVSISAGTYNSMALKSDGTVVAWGFNSAGQNSVPSGLSGIVAISAGRFHTMALRSNGTVLVWGTNTYGERNVPVGLNRVVAISAGNFHSVALTSDGNVVTWGDNTYGQLNVPASLTGVVAISAVGYHTLALKSNGLVVAWGRNNEGQTIVPASATGIVAVAAGNYHSMAMKSNGAVVAWGYNSYGQSTVPTTLTGGGSISGGYSHSMALTGAATTAPKIVSRRFVRAAASGDGVPGEPIYYKILATGIPASYAALGLPAGLSVNTSTGVLSGTPTEAGTFPVTITATNAQGSGSAEIKIFVTGPPTINNALPATMNLVNPVSFNFTADRAQMWTAVGLPPGLALDANGTLTGSPTQAGIFTATITAQNGFGSVSISWTVEVRTIYTWGSNSFGQSAVPAGLIGVEVAAGTEHSLVRKIDGTVVAWGNALDGRTTVPSGVNGVVAIAAGERQSLALKSDGSVISWGFFGTDIPDLVGIIAVSARGGHSMALKSDGTVFDWGGSAPKLDLNQVIAIAAGNIHSLALRSDGTVVAYGNNAYGQCTVPSGLADVVAIACGASHSLALRSDGTVVAWGANSSSQTNVPAGLSGVIAIAAGAAHSVALRADGSTVAWGSNSFGQSSGFPSSGVVSISAGGDRSMALIGVTSLAPQLVSPLFARTSAAGGGVTGEPFLYQIRATGAPSSFSAVGLPEGISLDPATGIMSGMTSEPGTYTVQVSATNTYGTGTFALQLYVNGLPNLNNILPSPRIFLETPLAHSFSGDRVAQWTAVGLPPGLSLDPYSGVLSGSPTQSGNFTATITAQNGFGSTSIDWEVDIPAVRSWSVAVPTGLYDVTSLAIGSRFYLGLRGNGTVFGWGDGFYGVLDIPNDLNGVVAISSKDKHSLALKSDGTVVAWGYNLYGQCNVPTGLNGVIAVAAGINHSLALKRDGTIVSWGSSGDNTPPANLTGIVAIAVGNYFSVALRSDGTVTSWGYQPYVQMVPPAGLNNVVAIAAGDNHFMALKNDNTVVTWGNDFAPAGLNDVTAIAAGTSHSLALKRDGTVVRWGSEATGTPVGIHGVAAIVAGVDRSLTITGAPSMVPVIVSGAFCRAAAIGAGIVGEPLYYRIAATGSPSNFAASGLPSGVSLDTSTGLITGTPTEPGTFTVNLTATNEAGSGSKSIQLFVGGMPSVLNAPPTVLKFLQPVNFSLKALHPISWSAVGLPEGLELDAASGVLTGIPSELGAFTATITVHNAFGTASITWPVEIPPVQIWGANVYNQNVVPAGVSDAIAVAVGQQHTLVLKTNGTVQGWGSTAVPAGLSNVVAISANSVESLALKSDGTVVAWGYNGATRTVPASLKGAISVSAGRSHSLALRKDGLVIAWGDNSALQSNVPSGLEGVVAIAGGGLHSLALKNNGTVVAWG